jgi:hypothetical protein
MKTKNLALTAVALAALSLSASPVFAEDAPTPASTGNVVQPSEAGKAGDRAAEFDKRGKEMFDKTDTNKDGFISREEMAASQKERMDEMFDKTDTNHDGKLSPEELKAGREAMREKFKAKYKDNKHGGPEDGQKDGKPGDKPVEEKKPTE